MNTKTLSFVFTFLLAAAFASTSRAEEISCLYIKNNNSYPVFVWVNDQPQGTAPAGKTCLVPREGFVTPDSGIQPDGTVKQTQANGGWEPTPTITVKAGGWTVEKKTDGKEEPALMVWTLPNVGASNANGDALVWLGEPPLSDEDRQLAMKLPPGSPPQETTDALPKATGTPPEEQAVAAGFGKGSSPVKPLWSGTDEGKRVKFKGLYGNDFYTIWELKNPPIPIVIYRYGNGYETVNVTKLRMALYDKEEGLAEHWQGYGYYKSVGSLSFGNPERLDFCYIKIDNSAEWSAMNKYIQARFVMNRSLDNEIELTLNENAQTLSGYIHIGSVGGADLRQQVIFELVENKVITK